MTRIAELETQADIDSYREKNCRRKLSELSGKRPDVAEISSTWASFAEIWEVLTEEEREELITLIVGEVRMVEKNKGSLQLILQTAPPEKCNFGSSWVRTTSKNQTQFYYLLQNCLSSFPQDPTTNRFSSAEVTAWSRNTTLKS